MLLYRSSLFVMLVSLMDLGRSTPTKHNSQEAPMGRIISISNKRNPFDTAAHTERHTIT